VVPAAELERKNLFVEQGVAPIELNKLQSNRSVTNKAECSSCASPLRELLSQTCHKVSQVQRSLSTRTHTVRLVTPNWTGLPRYVLTWQAQLERI
jgi:hypothetical protein